MSPPFTYDPPVLYFYRRWSKHTRLEGTCLFRLLEVDSCFFPSGGSQISGVLPLVKTQSASTGCNSNWRRHDEGTIALGLCSSLVWYTTLLDGHGFIKWFRLAKYSVETGADVCCEGDVVGTSVKSLWEVVGLEKIYTGRSPFTIWCHVIDTVLVNGKARCNQNCMQWKQCFAINAFAVVRFEWLTTMWSSQYDNHDNW